MLQELIKRILTGRTSKDRAIKASEIIDLCEQSRIMYLQSSQIREVVRELREQDVCNGYFIVSDTELGYWLSNDEKEIEHWLNSYTGRIRAMMPVVRSAKKFISREFHERLQMELGL
jgi:hypothetical protein